MDGDGKYFVWKPLHQLTRPVIVVPESHALVRGARSNERLPHTHVHACDRSLVVVGAQNVKVHLIGLHDLTIAQQQGVHLAVFQRAREVLLTWRDGNVLDLDRVVLNGERPGSSVHLLVILLKDGDHAAVLAHHKAFGVAHNALHHQAPTRVLTGEHVFELGAVLQQQNLSFSGTQQQLFLQVVGVWRHPLHAGNRAHVSFADVEVQRLDGAIQVFQYLEYILPQHPYHAAVSWGVVASKDWQSLLVGGFHGACNLGLLPHPQHHVPLRPTTLGKQQLAIRAERQAHILLRSHVWCHQHFTPLQCLQVVHSYNGFLRAFSHSQQLLVG
mmetsp:Transcript_22834/g.63113  ORF Transcript_22834/g.63113 Transcript_22834/m.63113 type:complete len:328 (-) Transcript_22834:345-1328(-)